MANQQQPPANPRRFRAVSFTLDAIPVQDLPNPPNNNNNNAQAQSIEDVSADPDSPANELQPILNSVVTSLLELDATKNRPNELAVAGYLDQVSTLLEREELLYLSSPVRSPLIVCRYEYPIQILSNHIHDANIVGRCFDFLSPDDTSCIELKRSTGRFLTIVGETTPESMEDFDSNLNGEQLLQSVLDPKDDEMRIWYTAIIGFALNERRGRQMADMAVLPLNPQVDSLPKVLLTRLRDDLAPPYLSSPETCSEKIKLELDYALKCLACMGEYQEMLGPALDLNILTVILDLIKVQGHTIQFGALEFASRLIAHKSFALKFVEAGGVEILLQVPTTRPIYLEASIAWCFSGLASLSTVMERVLRNVSDAPKRLMDFCLGLLKGQQDITRKNALFFLAHALAFPVVLYAFDNLDGPRVLLDLIAQPLALQRSISVANILKHTMSALRQYFNAHTAIAAHLVRTTKVTNNNNSRSVTAKRLSGHKPLLIDPTGHRMNIDVLSSRRSEVVQFLTQTKWRPVEELLSYSLPRNKNGIHLLLGVVKSCESEFGNNAIETCTCALQVLSIATILPLTYSEVCASAVSLPDGFLRAGMPQNNDNEQEQQQQLYDETTGLSIVLQVASLGNVDGQDHTEFILSALEILNNLVSPIWAEDSLQRFSRRAARESNALHVLLMLLGFKGRMSDMVRSLTVDCLLGLTRESEVASILNALNVDRVLSEIANSEPVIAEQAQAHKRLKTKALALLRVVSGASHKVEAGDLSLATDAAARKIARDAIVRRSNIQFHEEELFELIHEHLDKHGLHNAAKALYEEAQLGRKNEFLEGGRRKLWSWPKTYNRHEEKKLKISPNRVKRSASVNSQSSLNATTTPRVMNSSGGGGGGQNSVWKTNNVLGMATTPVTPMMRNNVPLTGLERLVKDHLRHQHEKCQNPISVPPPFPLIGLPHSRHQCPDVKPKTAPINTAKRLIQRQYFSPFGGAGGSALNIRSVHRQARWMRTYSVMSDDVYTGSFSSLTFRENSGRDDEIVIGTDDGTVYRFNAWTAEHVGFWDFSELLTDAQHGNVTSLQFANQVLLSTMSTYPLRAVLWKVQTKDDILPVLRLGNVHSALLEHRGTGIVGALDDKSVGLYNIEHGSEPHTLLKFDLSNDFDDTNVAVNKTDSLVLYDGLLWDAKRSHRPVFKFDKLSPYGNGAFNPSGLCVLLNKDVWDLRTYRLLQSASDSLDGAQIKYDSAGDVIFSHIDPMTSAYDEPKLAPFRHMIRVSDASSLSNIASYDPNRPTQALALHPSGGHFAIITHDIGNSVQNEARLYEIGRGKPDDNDSDVDDAQPDDDWHSASHSETSDDDDDDDEDDEDADEDGFVSDGVIRVGEMNNEADFGDAIMRAMNEIMQNGSGEEEDDDGGGSGEENEDELDDDEDDD